MSEVKNILFAGVGGQGVLLASTITANAALKAGFDAKKSEVHGMSQRGGVVTSHIRFGKKVYSPLIKTGEADILIAFEQAEALRWAHFIKPDGIIITDTFKNVPPIVATGVCKYPENILDTIKKKSKKVFIIDAFALASEMGNFRLANTIILGKMSSFVDIPEKTWTSVIEEEVPAKLKDINIKAFLKGRSV